MPRGGNNNNTGRYFPRAARVRTQTRRRRSIVQRNARRKTTRRGNKRAIMANSMLLRRLNRIHKSHLVYTDYVKTGVMQQTYRLWGCVALIDPKTWAPTMRTNAVVQLENSSYIKRATLNLYANLISENEAVTWNIFLCRLRKDYSNLDLCEIIKTPPPVPPGPGPSYPDWTNGKTYYRGTELGKVTLNSGMLKVMKHYYFTLTANRVDSTNTNLTPAGNPSSTYRRIQLSIPLNIKVNAQQSFNWKTMTSTNIPYYDQVYLLCVPDARNQATTNTLQYEFMATCINSD